MKKWNDATKQQLARVFFVCFSFVWWRCGARQTRMCKYTASLCSSDIAVGCRSQGYIFSWIVGTDRRTDFDDEPGQALRFDP
jgi:hypothetical protein